MLNKKDFVDMLAEEHNLQKNKVEEMVSIVIDGIKRAYEKHGGVRFVDFGTFSLREYGNRPGRNMRTNESVWIHKKVIPVFKPGRELKKIVNKTY